MAPVTHELTAGSHLHQEEGSGETEAAGRLTAFGEPCHVPSRPNRKHTFSLDQMWSMKIRPVPGLFQVLPRRRGRASRGGSLCVELPPRTTPEEKSRPCPWSSPLMGPGWKEALKPSQSTQLKYRPGPQSRGSFVPSMAHGWWCPDEQKLLASSAIPMETGHLHTMFSNPTKLSGAFWVCLSLEGCRSLGHSHPSLFVLHLLPPLVAES